MRPLSRRLVAFAAIATFMLFEAYYLAEYVINTPAALAEKATLVEMAERTKHPSNSYLLRQESGNKTTSAFVTALFTTTQDAQSLIQFYTAEFQRQGYVMQKVDLSSVSKVDSQRTVIALCKDHYTVRLRYKYNESGHQANNDWNYAIDFSWWSRGCEPR